MLPASLLLTLASLIAALLLSVPTGAHAEASLPLGLNFKISPGPDGIGGHPPAKPSMEQRLERLHDRKAKGLITENEYKKKWEIVR